MFGLFSSKPFDDPGLGQLCRTRGEWRGTLELDGMGTVELVVSGDRAAPHEQALLVARGLAGEYPGWRRALEGALYDHYEPYADSDDPADSMPRLQSPSDVWTHVTVLYVSVVAGRTAPPVIELGLSVAWDQEHTLGARFRLGQLVELNGSVLAP